MLPKIGGEESKAKRMSENGGEQSEHGGEESEARMGESRSCMEERRGEPCTVQSTRKDERAREEGGVVHVVFWSIGAALRLR